MAVRPEKIEELVLGALEGLEAQAADASASEVFSAMFTIAYRALLSAKKLGYIELTRSAIEQFYAQLPPIPPEAVQ